MSKLSRRSFLFACSASVVALTVPTVAMAAPSRTIVLEAVKDASGKYSSVRIPSGIASELGAIRAQELEAASNRALRVAQSQNLARPNANGLLTRIWRPSLRAAPRGIAQSLLQAGLVLGFAWALSNATGELGKDTSSMTMNAKECANLPVNPASDMWARSSGVYRTNASSSTAVAVQRTTGTSRGGTVAGPSGWSWAGQRAISTEAGVTTWEVQFTKNVACGERVAFPPGPIEGAVPGSEHGGNEADANSEANKVKIIDGLHKQAENDIKAGVPLPGGEIAGEVADVGADVVEKVRVPAPVTDPTKPITPIDLTTPRPQIGQDDTHVKFPPEVDLGTETPNPNPTPTPGTPTPTPTGSPIDWGTPPEGDMPGVPTPFAWMPTPWVAPDLPGSCQGVPYSFPVLKASGTINPCPVIAQARPVIRPVAVLGWTAYAIAQFLDL